MNMNEYDIRDAIDTIDEEATPNLSKAIRILYRLMAWTNRNSDGWPYWRLPSKASDKLQALIQSKRVNFYSYDGEADITEADLRRALTPIKSFLTKQGVDHASILNDPEPYCNHDEAALVDQGDGTVKCECGKVLRPVVSYVAVS